MNTFLNENWRLIYNEVGKDISMSLGQIVLDIIKESATSVPYNEIFDDVE
jgi:Haemolymph juvenile hormone binding protein (JHBP).